MDRSLLERESPAFEFVGSLADVSVASEDDEALCPSGRHAAPVCCSAGL